jgi:type IV secretory pathway VirB10-like protein
MAATKRSQNKCKKCGYTWYPRGKNMSLKCPSCGSSEVGFAGTGIGVIALIVIAAVIFGANKKETPTEAPSTSPEITKETTSLEHQTMQLEPESEQAATTTNIADVPDDTGQVEENIRTPALTNKCASENESKPEECSSVECGGKASDSARCESERAPKNELY